MPLSEVTLSAKLFSTNSYTLVKLLILVLRSSSGPLEAAETPVTPGPKTPPRTEQRTMTKAAKRTDRVQRGINTSHFQYSGVFPAAILGWSLSAADRAAGPGGGRFSLHRLTRRVVQTPHLIANANQEHGLFGVFENVDDPLLLVFQVDGFPIRYQMQIGVGLHDIAQPLAHFALQEPQDAPDLLKRKSLTAQFGDNRNFDYFGGLVDALVPLMPGGYHLALVPPLQLTQTDLGDARNVA